jgi:sulfur-carrier protein
MAKVNVKAFGWVAERLPHADWWQEGPDTSDAFLAHLYATYPPLAEVKFSLAVDKKLIQGDTPLHDGAELALLPPFSGG